MMRMFQPYLMFRETCIVITFILPPDRIGTCSGSTLLAPHRACEYMGSRVSFLLPVAFRRGIFVHLSGLASYLKRGC